MTTFGEIVRDAVSYWERRRLIYNAVLFVVTVAGFLLLMPRSLAVFEIKTIYHTFALAVGANVAYCTAYIPDILAQASAFREQWRRWRWVLFLVGTLLAVAIAIPTVMVFFAAPFSH